VARHHRRFTGGYSQSLRRPVIPDAKERVRLEIELGMDMRTRSSLVQTIISHFGEALAKPLPWSLAAGYRLLDIVTASPARTRRRRQPCHYRRPG